METTNIKVKQIQLLQGKGISWFWTDDTDQIAHFKEWLRCGKLDGFWSS
jgi:hypothetical protein